MLNMIGQKFQLCDGLTRRSLLRIGALSFGGLTLPNLLRGRAMARAAGRETKDTSVILIWQAGGPSHIDMYDLKPQAPAEFRGEFRPIETNVPGIQFGEYLPLQARIMDKLAIVRSATHTNAGHGMASQWMRTGYQPTIEVNDNIYPSVGSVVARLRGSGASEIPPYVTLPRRQNFTKAAYLGASFNPFSPESDPNSDAFEVRNLRLPGRIDADRLRRRRGLLGDLDGLRRDLDTQGTIAGLDKFYADALEIVTSDKTRQAFDIKREDAEVREEYGRNDLGQSCLLARRLVEAGVTFVSIEAGGGWDTHGDNFNALKKNLLPKFDRALAALVTDLDRRGQSDRVLVMAMGEFGRTPRINPQAGRDHWPGAMSVVYGGGGLKMGQVIGTTDPRAEYPATRPCSPGSILATMYRVLGVDVEHTFYDAAQRPLPVLNEGRPIEDLI
ncbi:MAG TPA: DUF1501 domain-containing protein [Pirellulales bacterium]|nr:DUF1501 domain-containing protein [Pirellulales bacterium]